MAYDINADFRWFKEHQDELVEQYDGKTLAIRNCVVLGAHDSLEDAVDNTPLPLGEYMVQLCIPGKEAYTVRIHTPWVFA